MRKLLFLFIFVTLSRTAAPAQTVTLMTWNLLSFTASSTDRVPYFKTVLDSIKPALLVVQEIENQQGFISFRDNVVSGSLSMAPFIDGPGSDNALFFDSTLFRAVANIPIPTSVRDISQFVLVHLQSGDTLRVFAVHLKANAAAQDQTMRLSQADSLRKATDILAPGSYYLVCGDFNFYTSSEFGYQRLIQPGGAGGYFTDPLTLTGTWNHPLYASYHTQSTRVRAFGGGSVGGLDDRFDLILFSPNFFVSAGIQYVASSTWAVGNDGLHYNDSINAFANTSVSQNMAEALHAASDHLPVVASIAFTNMSGTPDPATHKNFVLYPNPTTGPVQVGLPAHSQSRITLHNALGRKVFTAECTGSCRIDIRDLSAGLYFVHIDTGSSRQVSRLWKF